MASPDAAQVKEDLPGKDGAPGEVQAFRDYCWPDLPVFLDEKRAFYGALGGGKESKGSIASFFANLLNPFSQLYKNTKRVPKTTEGNFVGEGFIKGGARRRRGSVEGGWSAADASRRRRGDCSADASRHYRGDRHRGGVAAAPPGLFAEASRRRRGDRPRTRRGGAAGIGRGSSVAQVYVVKKGAAAGAPAAFAHAEAEIGDHPPTDDLLAALD